MERKKILLVDDSPTVLLMEQMILKKGPYDILTARDGKEGVLRAVADRPDLIVMDLVMPQMNGLEAVRKLRESDGTRAIPVIMVTTRGEAESVQAGYESGCSDYLTKPIDGAVLLAKVRDHLGV